MEEEKKEKETYTHKSLKRNTDFSMSWRRVAFLFYYLSLGLLVFSPTVYLGALGFFFSSLAAPAAGAAAGLAAAGAAAAAAGLSSFLGFFSSFLGAAAASSFLASFLGCSSFLGASSVAAAPFFLSFCFLPSFLSS